ncbi:MAG: ROK family protein [Clostridia bacterium]|nr:ROK family protein [Clostridia bacterium]
MVIEKNGIQCSCGRKGCFERYCSMVSLKESVRKLKQKEHISGKELYEIMKNDINSIKDIVDTYIENLAIGIANYINIFEPEGIAIGGSFVFYADILLEMLKERLKQKNITFNEDVPEIVIAEYGNNAGMIGASLM